MPKGSRANARLNADKVLKIANLHSPKNFKAKKKLSTQTVSKETFSQLTNNPEIIEQNKENPPVKNLFICPSNDPEDIELSKEEDVAMNTTPEDGDTASRKQSVAGSDNSYYDSQENPTVSPTMEKSGNMAYKTAKSLIEELERSNDSINTSEESQESMDTGHENTIIEKNDSEVDEFKSEYQSEPTPKPAPKTLSLPPNTVTRQLDFGGNKQNIVTENAVPIGNTNSAGTAGGAQSRGGPSSSEPVHPPAAPIIENLPSTIPLIPRINTGTLRRTNSDPRLAFKYDFSNLNKNTGTTQRTTLKADPRIKVTVLNTDIPPKITQGILNYNFPLPTSEEDNKSTDGYLSQETRKLPTSPNSTFLIRKNNSPPTENMETQPSCSKQLPFQTPKKFSKNFQTLLREKTIKTLTKTSNRYLPLSDESESEYEDDIDRIIKRKRVTEARGTKNPKNAAKAVVMPVETVESILAERKKQVKTPTTIIPNPTTNSKNKSHMPPIVIDGKTANQSTLVKDIKDVVKGKFSIKHTSKSTILFVDDKDDHAKMIENIKAEKLPFHTYTTNDNKTHAFVLRGLANGTKIPDIAEDLSEEHEIKTKEIFRMNTKNRPLFLVTDPSMTLDYLNKNVRRVLYTRVTWELRKSIKQIIQESADHPRKDSTAKFFPQKSLENELCKMVTNPPINTPANTANAENSAGSRPTTLDKPLSENPKTKSKLESLEKTDGISTHKSWEKTDVISTYKSLEKTELSTSNITNTCLKSSGKTLQNKTVGEPVRKSSENTDVSEVNPTLQSMEKTDVPKNDTNSYRKSLGKVLGNKSDCETDSKSYENTNVLVGNTADAELKSMENAAREPDTEARDLKSLSNDYKGAYSDTTEQQDSDESTDSINTSDRSHSSLEKSEVIRADSDKSLENLLNDLEGENEDSNSPENLDGTVLEMDLDESEDQSPKSAKNETTFKDKKKYVENTVVFESAYKTLPLPKNVTVRTLDCGQDSPQSDGSTITPGLTPPSGSGNRTWDLNVGGNTTNTREINTPKNDRNMSNVIAEANRVEGGSKQNNASNNKTLQKKPTPAPKAKNNMPPIIIDGKTASQNTLVQDIKKIVKGKFSIKHTNNSTILFLEEKEDHEKMVTNIKTEKLPFHTYSNRDEKTHAFVLRGLAEGTKIEDIDEDLTEEFDIKARSIYRMNTKNRPLFLIITDPSLTLDYLNKNVRRILYTRVVWEMRKSEFKSVAAACKLSSTAAKVKNGIKHVSTPKPKPSSRSESKSEKSRDPRKHSSNARRENQEKHGNSSRSHPDSDTAIKTTKDEVLHQAPETTSIKNPIFEKNTSTFSTMDKNPFFIPPTEGSKHAPEGHQMETEDSPNSLENTLIYQSAENSPLNTSEINPESASNTTDSAASQNKINTIKISENRESAVVTKNTSETTPDTFVSAYQTLPLPSSVTARVLNFRADKNSITSSEEENSNKPTPPPQPLRPGLFTLPPPIKASTPPNTQILLQKRKNNSPPEKDNAENDGEDDTDVSDNQGFQKPRKFKKFKTNFVKLIEQKAASTIPLSNKYDSLSESENEQDTVIAPKIKGKATPNLPVKGNSTKQNNNNKVTATKTNKKATIPPIVVDGRTDNHATLTKDLKAIIKGKYSVKYTNATTVIFTEDLEDYEALL
ncbi:unnamed protein product [Psylliodes chrysocephalus]|uniref:Uncharacterized protein n=1 Tax=Psylliodes chrysocephalus TaxID=3402493 RepID=A0A9P0D772_9CUCU|nr:unnamed protein product [Psylliodes chrysocephala]